MKFKILLSLIFLLSLQLNAQVTDDKKKSVKIPAEETKKKDTTPASITDALEPTAKPEAVATKENRQAKAKLRLQSIPVEKTDKPARSMPAMQRLKETADSNIMTGQSMQQQPAAAAAPSISSYGLMSTEEDSISNDKDVQEVKTTDRKRIAQQTLAKNSRPENEWLDHINKLIADNKLEEARAEWKAFEQSYPNHPDNKKLKETLTSHE